jgi:hypothetical protein
MLLSAEARSQEDDPLPAEDANAGPPEAESVEEAVPEHEPAPKPIEESPEAAALPAEEELAGPEKPELQLELEEPEGGWLSKERYAIGGITGSLLSFGIGHMIVGEWTNFGWVYTVSQLLCLGLIISGEVVFADASEGSDDQTRSEAMVFTGLGLLGVSYVIEKIDLFYRPHERLKPPTVFEAEPGEMPVDQVPRTGAEAVDSDKSQSPGLERAAVVAATGQDMDRDYEDYLESDTADTESFAEFVHRRYHKQRVWGIVMASVFTPVLLAASGGFAVMSAFGSDEFFGALSIGTGALGLASLGFGIWLAVRGLRVRDAVEPLLDENTEEASVRLRLTMLTDAHGIPSGGGLMLTF